MTNHSSYEKEISIAVILAAGMGTRMKSDIPKVLHPLLGEPMVNHVVRALDQAGVNDIFAVVGYKGEEVEKAMGDRVQFVYQKKQLGTGHALMMALPKLQAYAGDSGDCLVVYGDTPLLTGSTLASMRDRRRETGAQAVVLTAFVDDPTGYGRMIKRDGKIVAIVEEKDADEIQRQEKEINAGAYCFAIGWLANALENLTPANAQGEYYLTGTISWLVDQGQTVAAFRAPDREETLGINDRAQLAHAQEILRRRCLA